MAAAAAAGGATGATDPSGSAPSWERYLLSLEVFGMRPGLERVSALLDRLGRPERSFRAIHVVGTNGKSSTTRYAAAILAAHGRRAGAYLSPHITGFCERVLVDGRAVAGGRFAAAVETVRTACGGLAADLGPVTQFEVLTVAAFLALAREGVEAAAVEAGLGGRLDATNVLEAPVVVLTTVGLEHTEVLGDTREAVFAEKAAVIKGGDAVFGRLEGLEARAEEVCAAVGARPHFLDGDVTVAGQPAAFEVTVSGSRYDGLSLPTPAAYQTANAALAVAACHFLLGALDAVAVPRGLRDCTVPGRLQVVGERPLTLADGAHNPDGVVALVDSLAAIARPRPRVGLLAILRDKGVGEMVALLAPLFDHVVCTACREPRSLSAAELAGVVAATAPRADVRVLEDPKAALAAGRELAGRDGSLVVTGSLYLLADLAWLVGDGG